MNMRPNSASAPPVEAREEAIQVQVATGNLGLPIGQIARVEAARDYVVFHTATRGYIHRISMTALEKLLDPNDLMRVRRSTFTARRWSRACGGWTRA
jgi:two-component system response regulator AlgR